MEKSDIILLKNNKYRPAMLIAKRRLSGAGDVRRLGKFLRDREILTDNDYGFMDKVPYDHTFGFASALGYDIPSIENFMAFISVLRSGGAVDGNGERLSGDEQEEILDDILKPKDSFGGKYKYHGERFSDLLVEEGRVAYLVSRRATFNGPEEVSKGKAEYIRNNNIDSRSFNFQGLPQKGGDDWNFLYPGIGFGNLNEEKIEHVTQFYTHNESGDNVLVSTLLGVWGIYPGLGMRLAREL